MGNFADIRSLSSQAAVRNQWWRWPLLPFAAIAGALASSAACVLFVWFSMKFQGGYTEDGWYYLYVMPLMASATFGYVYALIAITVAPCGKVIAGTVLVTLLAVFGALTAFVAWVSPSSTITYAIQSTLSTVSMLCAALVVLLGEHQKSSPTR